MLSGTNTSFDEKQLTRRMQQGDREAFADFVDRYGGTVHRLARRYTRCEADAEDLTQEVFVDLCRGIGGFRGEAKLSTWVYRIALNHCLKHRGRRQLPDSVPLDDLPLAAGDDYDPERQAARGDLSRAVGEALETLSEHHRDVVLLHEIHGLTYVECADILGVPVGTVKSRLSNAFVRLRDRLGGYVRGEEEGMRSRGGGGATAALCEAGAASGAVLHEGALKEKTR